MTEINNVGIIIIVGICCFILGGITYVLLEDGYQYGDYEYLSPFTGVKSQEIPQSPLAEFNKCLTDKGLVFYGAWWCGYCDQQKTILGFESGDFKFIEYVECSEDMEDMKAPEGWHNAYPANEELCRIKKVGAFPSWEIDGQIYPGMQDLESLSRLSGCELKI